MGQIRSFVKNMFFEQSKRIVLLVIGFVYSFFIANFLGPADYGLIIYFINFTANIVNMFGVHFVQGMINAFIPKYRSKKLFLKFLKVQYVLVIPTVAALFLFAPQITSFLGKENPLWLQLAASILLVMPIYSSYLLLIKSFKRFDLGFKAETAMSALNFCFAFTAILLLRQGVLGVIYAQMMATILGISFLFYFSRKMRFEENEVPQGELKKYATPGLPSSIASRVYNQVLMIIMGLFVNNIMLGYYYLVQKMNDVLVGTSMSAMQDVLIPYAMEKHKDKKTLANFISINIKAGLIITAITGIFLLAVGWFALQLFFPAYANAYILMPFVVLIALLSAPLSIKHVFTALNEIKKSLVSEVAAIAVALVTALVFTPQFGIFGILAAMAVYAAANSALLYYFARKLDVNIEIIPKKKDIKFFLENLAKAFNEVKSRIRMKRIS